MKKIVILALFLTVAVGASFVAYRKYIDSNSGIQTTVIGGAYYLPDKHVSRLREVNSISLSDHSSIKVWTSEGVQYNLNIDSSVRIYTLGGPIEYKYLGRNGDELLFQETIFSDAGLTHITNVFVTPY